MILFMKIIPPMKSPFLEKVAEMQRKKKAELVKTINKLIEILK
jgi:hypothetical protein